MEAKSIYHAVLNMLFPGALAFKRGKFKRGFLLIFLTFLGVDLILMSSIGLFGPFYLPVLILGIALASGSWLTSQYACIGAAMRSDSSDHAKQLDQKFLNALTHYLRGDSVSCQRLLAECEKLDSYNPGVYALRGIDLSSSNPKKANKYLQLAQDMSQDNCWKWFLANANPSPSTSD